MKKLILIFFFIPSILSANWNTQDTIFQIGASLTIFIDFWQTYIFLYSGDYTDLHETNSILGRRPSKKRFFTYTSICTIGHPLISYILPSPYRTFWQFFWISAEINAINQNYQTGVRLKF